jgi:hypothetical protein
MIDAAILKKHNLKAVPFSCIGEGETFNVFWSLAIYPDDHVDLTRILSGNTVYYASDHKHVNPLTGEMAEHADTTVYVPVWRVTN